MQDNTTANTPNSSISVFLSGAWQTASNCSTVSTRFQRLYVNVKREQLTFM